MSYILDAIRKSDWERRRGQIPGVLDQHAARTFIFEPTDGKPNRLRSVAFVVAGGFAVVGVGVAAWSLSSGLRTASEAPPQVAEKAPDARTSRSAVTVLTEPSAAPVATAAPATAPGAAMPSLPPGAQSPQPMVMVPPGTGWALLPMVSTGAVGVPGAAAIVAAPSWADEAATGADLSEEEVAALLDSHGAPRPRAPAMDQRPRMTDVRPAAPAAAPSAGPASGGEHDWVANARAELASMAAAEKFRARNISSVTTAPTPAPSIAPPIAPTTAPASRPPRPTTAPPIDDLPAAVRDQLPAITMSVHLYADNAAVRRVRVNDVTVHEGDSVTKDLEVAAIVRDGVIFRFKGTEFFLATNEGWQPHSAAAR